MHCSCARRPGISLYLRSQRPLFVIVISVHRAAIARGNDVAVGPAPDGDEPEMIAAGADVKTAH